MKKTSTIFSFLFLCVGLFSQNWTVIPYDEISNESLRIGSFEEDNEGNIWGGNAFAGRVVKFDGSTWETFNNDVTGLDYDSPSVGEIYRDAADKLWFLSFGDGIATFDGTNWEHFNVSNSGIPSNLVADILEYDGKYWFVMGKRLVSYDGTTWQNIDIPDLQWNAGGLAVDTNGDFWVSGLNGDSVRKFDGENWEIFSSDNSNIGSNFLYYVEEVEENTFYFGGPNGRAALLENGVFTPSADIPNWDLGLGDYIIEIESNGSKDDVFFATGGGLFHLKNGAFTNYTTSNSPLTDNVVQTVFVASDGRVWLSTENEVLILELDPSSTTEKEQKIGLQIQNPVSENLTMKVNTELAFQDAVVNIYGVTGQLILTEKVNSSSLTMDVSYLQKGMYILEFQNQEGRVSQLFLKE